MTHQKLSDLHRAKRGMAALTACVVQTLNESDPTFQRRFLERLEAGYREIKDDWEDDVIQELELFAWTREYLDGYSQFSGQGDEFLKNYESE